ncbi:MULTISPECIES: VOC family protein [Prauserella salsuginis group]|uniref:VOC family protein n=1 Tax=Prauserella salsuginis TaxID=387889 RepID=A0ABW6G4R7_9PSEU|nr:MULTISPECIES: VOC family protein [Prauserella salsuginis group]MCR3718757.1 methylmalonyl-CoA epimerase (EC 5.1.99.1) [Prauserella flava]MCR3733327.1 methylmalonyl-CoA epimerase (EC 5.1.99.1) [Prauserella salsuginis]
MTRVHIDHVALCVKDLDQAIEDWTDILGVLTPELTETITYSRGSSDGTEMVWATFQNPDPTGVSIQMWAPGSPDSWVHKVLAKRGEFVHHIAFLSDNFGHTMQQCREAGLPVLLDEDSHPDTMPWLKWNFLPESKAHGVLIELATRYQVGGDRWLPHPGNAENDDLQKELTDRFYTDPGLKGGGKP